MKRFRGTLLLACLTPCLATPVRGQSVDDVRTVLDEWFGPDVESAAAKARMREWGNDALPLLRRLADEPPAKRGWALVCAIDELRTPESLDLLVAILAGETRTAPRHALGVLSVSVRHFEQGLVDYLHAHPDFKPSVERVLRSGSWLERGQAASICAAMSWRDLAPAIEGLLEDENRSLRATAAEALSTLLGQPVPVETESVFPEVRLIPSLVKDPVRLENASLGGISEAFLLPRRNAPDAFIVGNGRAFAAYPWGSTGKEVSFPEHVIDLRFLAHGTVRQRVGLVSKLGFGGAGADHAVAWDEEGRELWRYEPPRRGLFAFATLHGPREPYGVVFGPGGDTGMVAVDTDGRPLWEVPRVYVLYELHTRPELPGELLVVMGNFALAKHSPQEVDAAAVNGAFIRDFKRGAEHLYANTGALFPGAEGRPAFVVAGTGPRSAPVLARFDHEYRRQWKVTLPHKAARLCLLEVEGRERLLVVATTGGELFLVDERGTLRWQGDLPGDAPPDAGRRPVFELVAGRYGAGEVMIALMTSEGFFLYPVRPELLPREGS